MTSGDFTLTNGATIDSISPTSGNAAAFTITVNNPSNASGSYTVTLNANAVTATNTYKSGPTAADTSGAVSFDRRVFVTTWQIPTFSGNRLTALISFSHSAAGIESSDFEVINSSGVTQTGWTIGSVTSSISANNRISIRATPPNNINGTFGFRLKANSIQFDGSSSNNGPTSAVSSNTISVDNRTRLAVTSFTSPGGTHTGGNS